MFPPLTQAYTDTWHVELKAVRILLQTPAPITKLQILTIPLDSDPVGWGLQKYLLLALPHEIITNQYSVAS